MKLWILTRKDRIKYDEYEFHVVSAESPSKARKLASEIYGDEGSETWLRANLTKCEEFVADSEGGIMCSGFRPG